MQLGIAGIPLEILSEGYKWELPFAYRGFATLNDRSPAQVLSVYSRNFPSLHLRGLVFKAGGSWTLYIDQEGQFVFDILVSVSDGYKRRLALFTPDFASAKVYVQPNQKRSANATDPFPLEYPLHRLALINLLAQGHGIMLHAGAIVEGGRAIVFSGPSGAGKSTLARLYGDEDRVTILSDDMIVARKIEGRYWAFGTPWCGPASTCSPLGAPIDRVYVIEHAPENSVKPIRKVDAAATLFSHTFIPFYRRESIDFNLGFLTDLGASVPCYRLGFVPDASVISFLRQMGRG